MQKILLIASIVLMAIGMILFFLIGALITHDFNCMWAGIGIFLIGVATFIVWIFLKAYLSRKEEEKNNIKRG